MTNVICVDDKDKPSDFPSSKWIKEGSRYTIDKIDNLPHLGIHGCTLVEIPDMPFPHLYFRLTRFRELEDDFDKELQDALDEIYLETIIKKEYVN